MEYRWQNGSKKHDGHVIVDLQIDNDEENFSVTVLSLGTYNGPVNFELGETFSFPMPIHPEFLLPNIDPNDILKKLL